MLKAITVFLSGFVRTCLDWKPQKKLAVGKCSVLSNHFLSIDVLGPLCLLMTLLYMYGKVSFEPGKLCTFLQVVVLHMKHG